MRMRNLLAIALGVLASGACGEAPLPDAHRVDRRVVLIALDGAAWRVADPLLQRGELPTLAELIARGCRGTMRSLKPSLSPRIWTSVATGVPPEEHGILGFVREVDGRRVLYDANDVAVPRFWELASDAGIPVGIVNWWFTYPARPTRGFIISDHTIPSQSVRWISFFSKGESPRPEHAALVHPPQLISALSAPLADAPDVPTFRQDHSFETLDRLIRDVFWEDRAILAMAEAALAQHATRFLAVYFKGIDRASHRLWRAYEPEHPHFASNPPAPGEVERYGGVIPEVYRRIDGHVGAIAATLAPEDVLLIVSDHGFEAARKFRNFNTGGHGQSPLSTHGIYLAAGGPVDGGRCPDEISLYDVAPTVLHLLGQGVPDNMRGEVPEDLFERGYLDANPVVRRPAVAKAPAEAAPLADEIEAQRIERLKSLGYLED